ncbi:MAG: hypothetical protein Q9177_002558 [Variospora cf. flavescens]
MTTSTDQNRLDRLTNSPRMSYMSTGAKTFATSRETSPIPSPSRLNFHLDDFSCRHEQSEKVDSSVKASIESPVMHLPQEPLDQSLPSTLTRPLTRALSTVKISPGKSPAASGAPNFSVPCFRKRYSSAHSSPPPLSTASSTTSKPSRKATSPPAIAEQHSDFQIIDDAAAEASATDLSDPEASVAELQQSVPPHASTERVVPRRFSSLEYSRGVRQAHSTSPHPPPTSALPALPETGTGNLSAPTPILRRPISVNIHSCPLPSTAAEPHSLLPPLPSPTASHNNLPSSPLSRAPPPPPPPPPPVLSAVSVQRSEQRLSRPATEMLKRRSMPHLSHPPSDPPDCPLPVPPVPRLLPIKLSTRSLRRSMERPLRAGPGARTAGLVAGDEV